jgi:cephalosporin hydroxylase
MKKIKGQHYINFSLCKSVTEVQNLFLSNYNNAHGETYIKYLFKIKELLDNCNSYRELGTNQGASAFIAISTKVQFLDLIDISFEGMETNKSILDLYAKDNNKKINYYENSSLDIDINYSTDFLFVDSLHEPNHVKKEIEKYHPLTSKYIMFHDTTLYPKLMPVIKNFLNENSEWEILEIENSFAGHTIIKRK